MSKTKPPSEMPSIVDLMHPALEALKKLGGSGHVSEIDNVIAEMLDLSDDVLSFRDHKADRLLYSWRCRWARTHLKSGEAVDNTERGVWAITKKGRSLTPDQMRDFLNESNRAARKRKLQQKELASEGDASADEDAELSWEDELLNVVHSMSADGFERLAQRILRESNFSKVEVTGRSGDGGIDGTGVLNIGLISFQVLFQCKKYKETVTVGPGAIRDFRGAMVGRTDKGLFLTTGRFTPAARKEATRDGAPPIDLIDGSQLCDLLKKLELGVDVELVEQTRILPEFFENI